MLSSSFKFTTGSKLRDNSAAQCITGAEVVWPGMVQPVQPELNREVPEAESLSVSGLLHRKTARRPLASALAAHNRGSRPPVLCCNRPESIPARTIATLDPSC